MPFLPKDVVENCLGATQAQNRHLSYRCVYPLRLLRYTDLCSLSVFSRLSQCVSTYFTALPYTATTSRSIFSRQRGGKRELSRYFLAPIRSSIRREKRRFLLGLGTSVKAVRMCPRGNIGIRTQIRLSLFDVRTPLCQLSYIPIRVGLSRLSIRHRRIKGIY